MTIGKFIALTRWTFIVKVMSLLFNMLSNLVITFHPRSKYLLISWLQSPSAVILEPPKMKSVTVFTVSLFAMKWWDWKPWSSFSECWALSQHFHSPLSLSSRVSWRGSSSRGSSSLSAISVVSSAYLRLLIFLPAILILAYVSFSPAFLVMCSECKLSKQGDNIHPRWCIPFPIWNQSVMCSLLTVTSWPASQEAGQMVWYFHLFQNFPQFVVIHTVKSFDIVNKAEIDVSLGLSCLFNDPEDIGNLIFGSSAFSKTSLNIWMFKVNVLLKPGLENFEHYFAGMWDECNCAVVWAFFVLAFLWDWNENWPLPVLWPLLSFPNLLAYWVQHFHSIIFQDLK